MDVNGIGLTALSGYMGAWGQKPAGDISQRVAAHITELDADGDGALSVEESEVSAELFNQADADGDGQVTEEELLAMMEKGRPQGPPPGMEGGMGTPPGGSAGDMAASIIEELDSDGDGGLSSSEAGASEEEFDAMDTNEDGVVSQAELEAAMTTIMGSVQSSGLGFGAQAVNAAGGMAAYRQEMDRLILEALNGDESGEESDSLDSSGILSDTGSTGSIDVTA